MTLQEVSGWSVPVAVGIISLLLAVSLPIAQIEWSVWVYFSMLGLVPLHKAYFARKRD